MIEGTGVLRNGMEHRDILGTTGKGPGQERLQRGGDTFGKVSAVRGAKAGNQVGVEERKVRWKAQALRAGVRA